MSDFVFSAFYVVLTIVGILAFLVARKPNRQPDETSEDIVGDWPHIEECK